MVAIKLSEDRLRNVGGVSIELIQKVFLFVKLHPFIKHNLGFVYDRTVMSQVAEEAGGVRSATCNSFLSELEEYDEEVGLMLGINNQSAKALLLPIDVLMDSSLIMLYIECMVIVNI